MAILHALLEVLDTDKPRDLSVYIFSFVGGGPVGQLKRALNRQGLHVEEVALFSLPQWRWMTGRGRLLRVMAKSSGYTLFPLAALAIAWFSKPGIVITTSNPFFLPLLMSLTKRWHKKPVVLWLYDWLPTVIDVALPHLLARPSQSLANRFTAWQLDRLNAFVPIGKNMASLAESLGSPLPTTETIEIGASRSEFSRVGARNDDGMVRVSYIGNLGRMHDGETVIAGLVQWKPMNGVVFELSVSGVYAQRLQKAVVNRQDVICRGSLDELHWIELLTASDIAIVSQRQGARLAPIPSKTYSAMASGAAILAIAPAGSELYDLVRCNKCGLVVEPGNVKGFVAALKELVVDSDKREAAGHACLRVVRERLDIDKLAKKWCRLLDVVSEKESKEGSSVC